MALNRAVAVAEVDGPAAALRLVESLAARIRPLDDYPLLHAIRADLLERLGRRDDAVAALDAAISRSGNAAERRLLDRRRTAWSKAVGRRLIVTAGAGAPDQRGHRGHELARVDRLRQVHLEAALQRPGAVLGRAKAVSAAAGTSRTGSADARRRMKS